MNETLQCSESYCNLHDYQINCPGICLRQDALMRSTRMSEGVGDVIQGLTPLNNIISRLETKLQKQRVPVARPAPKTFTPTETKQPKPKENPGYRWKH